MFFSEYLRIFGANNIRGRCTRWAQLTWVHQDPQARPSGLWTPCGPPHLSLHTTSSLTSRKKNLHCYLSLSLVFLLSNPRISISLLEAPFSKLFRGIVAWYVTPPFVQLVFVLVVYFLNNQLLLVLLQMSLHVEFLEF